MRRAERRAAVREGRRVRTLGEADYLLGVADEARLGALRLKCPDDDAFRASATDGVPPLIALGKLLASTDRVVRDEASDEDLALVLAPGSSLGGARPKASIRDAHALYRRMVFNVLIPNVDDHLRNHGALYEPGRGWRLSPVYDLNPTPVDIKARVLATAIDDGDGTCSVALLREVAPLFDLARDAADAIVGEVAAVTRRWRPVAARFGEPPGAIERMASAFEHADLDAALALRGRAWLCANRPRSSSPPPGRLEAARSARGDRRQGPPRARGHGRVRQRVFAANPRAADNPGLAAAPGTFRESPPDDQATGRR